MRAEDGGRRDGGGLRMMAAVVNCGQVGVDEAGWGDGAQIIE